MPEVSIIMPTYNRPEMLKRALSSIKAQTFKDYEVILVNDGELPINRAIGESGMLKNVFVAGNSYNLGQSKSLNVGLTAASGKYIAYLDDDDIYFANHLEMLHTVLDAKGYDFAHTSCLRTTINPSTGIIKDRMVLPTSDFTREMLLTRNYIHIASVMHRRDCLDKSGIFDESLRWMKDWDLFVRLSRYFNFHHINKITCEAFFRTDKSNMTFQFWDERIELSKQLRKKYEKLYGGSI